MNVIYDIGLITRLFDGESWNSSIFPPLTRPLAEIYTRMLDFYPAGQILFQL